MSRPVKRQQKESNSYYNEKEIRTINYDTFNRPLDQLNYRKNAEKKKDDEMSLEVEIADSLKRLLDSPDNCESRLLDVTIIRPSDKKPGGTVETSTVPFGKKEIKDLIKIIEKQKHEKQKHIAEQKKKLYKKINVHDKGKRPRSHSPPQKLSSVSEPSRPKTPKGVKFEKKNKRKNGDINTGSGPPNFNLQKLEHEFDLKCLREGLKLPPNSSDFKKKIKKYKNIESRLLELCNNPSFLPSPSRSFSSEEDLEPERHSPPYPAHQQVYAAPRTTFEDVKARYKCLNRHKIGKPDEPCVCAHCGTIGVLIDSQKGPVLPVSNRVLTPWLNSNKTTSTESKPVEKKAFWKENLMKSFTRHNGAHGGHECLIKQMDLRLNSLEERVTLQEQRAVTREYFKTIISKLLSYKNIHTIEERKDNCVQCGSALMLKQGHHHSSKSSYRLCKHHEEKCGKKHDKNKMSYFINPVLIEDGTFNSLFEDEDSFDADLLNQIRSKSFGCHINKIDEVDELLEETDTPKESTKSFKTSENAMWRWGEEIIKPGFDLKNKIMSLLEEKLQSLKSSRKRGSGGSEAGVQVNSMVRDESNKRGNSPGKLSVGKEKRLNDLIRSSDRPCMKYPIDLRKAMDDTTFRRNIEACKEATNWKQPYERLMKGYESADSTSTDRRSNKSGKKRKPSKRRSKSNPPSTPASNQQNEISYSETSFKQRHKQLCDVYKGQEEIALERKNPNLLDSKAVQIAYINPNATKWFEESISSVSKHRLQPNEKKKKDTLSSKLQYLKALAKSKNINEDVLWESILKQMKNYSKKNEEKVKVQIPTEALFRLRKHDDNVTELELSLTDLENIIKKSKTKKVASNTSQSGTNIGDNKKRLHEFHRQIGAMLGKNRHKYAL